MKLENALFDPQPIVVRKWRFRGAGRHCIAENRHAAQARRRLAPPGMDALAFNLNKDIVKESRLRFAFPFFSDR